MLHPCSLSHLRGLDLYCAATSTSTSAAMWWLGHHRGSHCHRSEAWKRRSAVVTCKTYRRVEVDRAGAEGVLLAVRVREQVGESAGALNHLRAHHTNGGMSHG